MQNKVFSFHFVVMLSVLVFCLTGGIMIAASQEDTEQTPPLEISFKLYSISKAELMDLLKEGITKKEFNTLETDWFKQNGLFEKEEVKVLKKGENNITIPYANVESFINDQPNTMIVFFYTVMRRGEIVNQTFQLTHRSYAITEKDGVEEIFAEKKGTWTLPAGSKKYRYFDFRSAVRFLQASFVYEIEIPLGENAEMYKIIMNVIE